jgi:hypothetical protein
MTRTDISYPENPEFTAPRLLVGDIVFIYVKDEQPKQWTQARIVQADLWNGEWEYEAITESTLCNEFDAEKTTLDIMQTFLFRDRDIQEKGFLKQTKQFPFPQSRGCLCILIKDYK